MLTVIQPVPGRRGTWPVCARCGKFVDRLVSTERPFGDGFIVVAFCHGSASKVEVSRAELEASGSIAFGGTAFAGSPR